MPHKFITTILVVLTLFLSLGITQLAQADEIIIESNGDDSDSSVNISSNDSSSTNQSNETDVDNKVDSNSDTGDNDASDNTGSDVVIVTGDSSSTTDIHNQVNISIVSDDCCASEDATNVTINGNGSNSQNQVDVTNNNQTNANINQQADISNTINAHQNTGNNTASDNNADVNIITGDITSADSVANYANQSKVEINCCEVNSTNLKISGNGSDSINNLHLSQSNIVDINSEEALSLANIDTLIKKVLTTGDNTALANIGTINVITGDIISTSESINKINDNQVTITCDCDREKPEPPIEPPIEPPVEPPIEPPIPPIPPEPPIMPPETPVNPPDSGSGGSSSSSSGVGGTIASTAGDILGTTSNMLPATGSYWWLMMTINVMMLLLGSYLRLFSGRSPGMIFA